MTTRLLTLICAALLSLAAHAIEFKGLTDNATPGDFAAKFPDSSCAKSTRPMDIDGTVLCEINDTTWANLPATRVRATFDDAGLGSVSVTLTGTAVYNDAVAALSAKYGQYTATNVLRRPAPAYIEAAWMLPADTLSVQSRPDKNETQVLMFSRAWSARTLDAFNSRQAAKAKAAQGDL